MYNQKANGTNYGYRIRYTSESTTNPDYNMLRSMEYPTASEQPLFTVSYAYSLPSVLTAGTVYSFLNAGSSKYLDVSNGTDADNNNVAQYKGNSTVSQKKLLSNYAKEHHFPNPKFYVDDGYTGTNFAGVR